MLARWKSVKNKYSLISVIARDILTVPMSTIASKSTFSTDRRILDEKKSRMTSKIIEMLLCYKVWLNIEMRLQDKDGHDTTSDNDDNTNTTDI